MEMGWCRTRDHSDDDFVYCDASGRQLGRACFDQANTGDGFFRKWRGSRKAAGKPSWRLSWLWRARQNR